MIPNRVFQTHKDRRTVERDSRLRHAQQSWARATQDYRFYDDAAQDSMMKEEFPRLYPLWARLPLPVMKADVWRYAVVYRYGGIYADADTAFRGNSTEILRPRCLLCVMPEDPGSPHAGLCNWWFAAPAGSPVLGQVLRHITLMLEEIGPITRKHFRENYHIIHKITGPAALTDGVRRWAASVGWSPPRSFRGWERNRLAQARGLCVHRRSAIHRRVVTHMFSGQWSGGWCDQRARLAGVPIGTM